MADRFPPGSSSNPGPVRWDAGRDRRGSPDGPATPRCTTRACPIRWRDGDDRPCREHRDEDVAAVTAVRYAGLGQPDDADG
jgi:hypothetical protein